MTAKQACVLLPSSGLLISQWRKDCGDLAKKVAERSRKCAGKQGEEFIKCMALCLGEDFGYDWCVDNFCRVMPNATECTKGNPC